MNGRRGAAQAVAIATTARPLQSGPTSRLDVGLPILSSGWGTYAGKISLWRGKCDSRPAEQAPSHLLTEFRVSLGAQR